MHIFGKFRLVWAALLLSLGGDLAHADSFGKSKIDKFLKSTHNLVLEGVIDRDIRYVFDSFNHPSAERIIEDIYNKYCFAVEEAYEAIYRPRKYNYTAINEPYDPSASSIHVYILNSGADDWVEALNVSCGARAFISRDVIVVDQRLLEALATGQKCTKEHINVSEDDRAALAPWLQELGGFDEASIDGVSVIDAVQRHVVPLMVIGHEVAHLILHRSRGERQLIETPDAFEQYRLSDQYWSIEGEADFFAVDLLIYALTKSNYGDPIEEALTRPSDNLKYLFLSDFLFNNRLRGFVGASFGEGTQAYENCLPSLILGLRILDITARYTYYDHLLEKMTVEFLEENDANYNGPRPEDIRYDTFYLESRDRLGARIERCL